MRLIQVQTQPQTGKPPTVFLELAMRLHSGVFDIDETEIFPPSDMDVFQTLESEIKRIQRERIADNDPAIYY